MDAGQSSAQGPDSKRDTWSNEITVNPAGLADSLSANDQIGFAPYVRALAWFLLSEKTKPPLTVSIEGPWGVGKSSFMLQLRTELTKEASANETNVFFVDFNAWRADKNESVWASFAIELIRQLSAQSPYRRRAAARLKLFLKRTDWGSSKWKIFIASTATVAFLYLTIKMYILNDSTESLKQLAKAGGGVAAIGAAIFTIENLKKLFDSSSIMRLALTHKNPDYEKKISFLQKFQSDFKSIVESYTGKTGRVYVFIDDLDRCDVPKAADVMQAINFLLSTDQVSLFFVMGLDREMVAAGFAAKYENIMPYIAAGRVGASPDLSEIKRVGLDYGYAFLEKFIQLPFRVPTIDQERGKEWISALLDDNAASAKPAWDTAIDHKSFKIATGRDLDEINGIVNYIATRFMFTPRKLKQFINIFRLRVLISVSTGILFLDPYSGILRGGGISLSQIGVFTALILKWPRVVGELSENPKLFEVPKELWAGDPALFKLLSEADGEYSLAKVDLTPLLVVMPDVYGGSLGKSTREDRDRSSQERPFKSVLAA